LGLPAPVRLESASDVAARIHYLDGTDPSPDRSTSRRMRAVGRHSSQPTGGGSIPRAHATPCASRWFQYHAEQQPLTADSPSAAAVDFLALSPGFLGCCPIAHGIGA